MMGVGDGHGQCIGCIAPCDLRARQEAGHHRMDLRLVRIADANHGLLHEACGIFPDLHAGSRRCQQHDAARLPELERRLRIGIDEHLLHRRTIRLVLEDKVRQRRIECQQPRGQG